MVNEKMIKLPKKQKINEALNKKQWDLGNYVLYKLCRDYPKHNIDSEIIAKVWLIGRSYSASIERRRNKTNKRRDFYEDDVVQIFQKSSLDKHLEKINNEKQITLENIGKILQTHNYLMKRIRKITDQNKRSFCSKYLHFHMPELFIMYDSRTNKTIGKYIKKIPNEFNKLTKCKNVDVEYAKFFIKCFVLKNHIHREYKRKLTNRELDKILLYLSSS